MLKAEPSPQTQVMSTLEQVFLRTSLYLAVFILLSNLTSLPVFAAEKPPCSRMSPSPCFTTGMEAGDEQCLLSTRQRLTFCPKSLVLSHQTTESFPHALNHLNVFTPTGWVFHPVILLVECYGDGPCARFTHLCRELMKLC